MKQIKSTKKETVKEETMQELKKVLDELKKYTDQEISFS